MLCICHLDSVGGRMETVSMKEGSWTRQAAWVWTREHFRVLVSPLKTWWLLIYDFTLFSLPFPSLSARIPVDSPSLRIGEIFSRNTAVGHSHHRRPLATVWACQLHSLLHSSQHLGVWGCGPVRKSKLSTSLGSWWVNRGYFLFITHIWMQLLYSTFELP